MMDRLVINLTDDDEATLDALTRGGRTRTDVTRRALAVLRYVEDVQRDGGRMLVRQREGDTYEVVWP